MNPSPISDLGPHHMVNASSFASLNVCSSNIFRCKFSLSKYLSKFCGDIFILGNQQLHCAFCVTQSPDRIYSRGNRERDLTGRQFCMVDVRALEKRFYARTRMPLRLH